MSSTLYPIKQACALTGCSERAAYRRAREHRPLIEATGDTPEVPILRVCGTWKVPKHLLDSALRLDPTSASDSLATPPAGGSDTAIEVQGDTLSLRGGLPARQSSAPHARPSTADRQQQGVA
jgi:hypothetical protein